MSGNIIFTKGRKIICFCVLILLIGISALPQLEQSAKVSSENGIKLPVIMYHSVLKDKSKSGEYIITPDAFEADLEFLSRNGYTPIFVQELIDHIYKKSPLPSKPIILTFDDGHYNNLIYVLPLLEKYEAKALISIVGEYTDRYSKNPDENANYAYLSWKNVSELLASGRIEIGNHSYNMHYLNKNGRKGCRKKRGESVTQYQSILFADLMLLQNECYENLGFVPSAFTYPFGSISYESESVIKEIGFAASFSCEEGENYITGNENNLYLLKRFIRTSGRSVEKILSR